jgi:hypothetical protein
MSAASVKALHTALAYLDQGNWDAAHRIVQADESAEGRWIHGIVHVMEGDLDNARYWYRRAERTFSENIAAEMAAVRQRLA